jgi:hypothetical protein
MRSNNRKPTKGIAVLDSSIGHFISSKYASMFAQNAQSTNTYSNIRRECFRTNLCGSVEVTGLGKFLSPTGHESAKQKQRRRGCCIRQGC